MHFPTKPDTAVLEHSHWDRTTHCQVVDSHKWSPQAGSGPDGPIRADNAPAGSHGSGPTSPVQCRPVDPGMKERKETRVEIRRRHTVPTTTATDQRGCCMSRRGRGYDHVGDLRSRPRRPIRCRGVSATASAVELAGTFSAQPPIAALDEIPGELPARTSTYPALRLGGCFPADSRSMAHAWS
jgi:hypothetical protein